MDQNDRLADPNLPLTTYDLIKDYTRKNQAFHVRCQSHFDTENRINGEIKKNRELVDKRCEQLRLPRLPLPLDP
jgi:hypothetical protein